jgi:hypothetical protein
LCQNVGEELKSFGPAQYRLFADRPTCPTSAPCPRKGCCPQDLPPTSPARYSSARCRYSDTMRIGLDLALPMILRAGWSPVNPLASRSRDPGPRNGRVCGAKQNGIMSLHQVCLLHLALLFSDRDLSLSPCLIPNPHRLGARTARQSTRSFECKPPQGPTTDREITCLSCGAPLPGREGPFILKYFLVERPKRRAGRR